MQAMKVWGTAIAAFALGVACTFFAFWTLLPEAAESVGVKKKTVVDSSSFALPDDEWDEGSSDQQHDETGNRENDSSLHKYDDDVPPVMDCYMEKGQPSWLDKWNPPSCTTTKQRPLSQHHDDGNNNNNPLVSIVTAFDDNHLLAAVRLLQSLILAKYEGQLGIYLLLKEGQTFTERMKSLPAVVANTSLAPRTLFGTLESHDFSTYCFKSQVIQDYLYRTSSGEYAVARRRPDVLIWADAHIRFKRESISQSARMLLDDNVHFAAKTGVMGMVENTHQDTYDFLEVDPLPDYLNRVELCACLFMINMNVASVVHEILDPYLHCAVNACRQCMAPIGTRKRLPDGKKWQGPGGATFLAHRQDQSVLSILAYEYELHHPNTTRLGKEAIRRYVNWLHDKRDFANNVEDLLDESWYVNKTM